MGNFEVIILKGDRVCKRCGFSLNVGKKVLRVKNRKLGDSDGYIYYHNKMTVRGKRECDGALAMKRLFR